MMRAFVSGRFISTFSPPEDAQALGPGTTPQISASLAQHRAGVAMALDAMHAVALEKLQQRADASKGWIHFGSGEFDPAQEKQSLDSLFAKAKTSLEQGRIARPLALLARSGSNAEEVRFVAEFKADPLMCKLDSLGREQGHASRSLGLADLARELSLKSADLPQSAEHLAQLLEKDPAAAKSAAETLAMIHGTGGVGLKVAHTFPRLPEAVTKPSAVVGMTAVPFAGAVFEMAGLRAASWFWQGESLGVASRLGASVFGGVGQAGAFTLLHNTVDSATRDPAQVWANTGLEVVSNAVMFNAMGLADAAKTWTTARMAEGAMNVAWLPRLGTAASGLTAPGRFLSGVLDHGGAVLAMQGSGAVSRWAEFLPDNGQRFSGNFVDTWIQHGQARLGGAFAHGMTPALLRGALAEFRARLAPASLLGGDLKPVPNLRPVEPVTEPKSKGERRSWLQNPLFTSLSTALGAFAPPTKFGLEMPQSHENIIVPLLVLGVFGTLGGIAGYKLVVKPYLLPKRWARNLEAWHAKIPNATPQELGNQLARIYEKYLPETQNSELPGHEKVAKASLRYIEAALPSLDPKNRLTALIEVAKVLLDGGESLAPLALRILKDVIGRLDLPIEDPERLELPLSDRSKLAAELQKGLGGDDREKSLNAVLALVTLMPKLSDEDHIRVAGDIIGNLRLKTPEGQYKWNNHLYKILGDRDVLQKLPQFIEELRNKRREQVNNQWDIRRGLIGGIVNISGRLEIENVHRYFQAWKKRLDEKFRERSQQIPDPDDNEVRRELSRQVKREGIFMGSSIDDVFHFVDKMAVYFGQEVTDDDLGALRDRIARVRWYTHTNTDQIDELSVQNLGQALRDRIAELRARASKRS